MDTKILEDIGLTNAEIRVYIALLELGTSTAGPIINKTKLQSSVVHATVNKLLDKGFITFTKISQHRQYQPTNPKNIVNFIENKKQRFQELLPELLIKQQSAKARPQVTMFQGIKGVRELLYELLEAGGKEHHTFGSAKESLILGDAWWVEYHKQRAKRGIKAKLLFNQSLQHWRAEVKYPKSKVKYTKQGFEPLTETIIRNTKIGIIIWTKKPIGVLIDNPIAAKSYNHFFEMMWKQAK